MHFVSHFLPTDYIENPLSATMVQKVYVTYNQVSLPSPPGATGYVQRHEGLLMDLCLE